MASSQPAFPASCTGHRSPLEQLLASRGRTTDRETMTTTGGDSGGPPQRDGPWERADLRLARPAGLSGQSICRALSRSRRGDVPGERRRVPSAPRRLTLPGHPHSAYRVPSPALLALTGLLDSPSPARGRTCLPQPAAFPPGRTLLPEALGRSGAPAHEPRSGLRDSGSFLDVCVTRQTRVTGSDPHGPPLSRFQGQFPRIL